MIEEILGQIEKLDKEGAKLLEKEEMARVKSRVVKDAVDMAELRDENDKYSSKILELGNKRKHLISQIGELSPSDGYIWQDIRIGRMSMILSAHCLPIFSNNAEIIYLMKTEVFSAELPVFMEDRSPCSATERAARYRTI